MCGYTLRSDEVLSYDSADSGETLKSPSGFRRTLSTEFLERQSELRALVELNELVASREFEPGEVIIHKGERNRDLYLLTEGRVEISTTREAGNLVLNEIDPPYIIGDIAFLSGFPRTATATAKTKAKLFVMKYEKLRALFKELPVWLQPLLTSLVSGIKTLHFKNEELRGEIIELRSNKTQLPGG
jgi:CRP-like cAMP-binding protein